MASRDVCGYPCLAKSAPLVFGKPPLHLLARDERQAAEIPPWDVTGQRRAGCHLYAFVISSTRSTTAAAILPQNHARTFANYCCIRADAYLS